MHLLAEHSAKGAVMSTHEHAEGEFSLTEPQSSKPGEGTPARTRKDSETLGESSGGFLGAVTGMSIGAIGGPVGLVIGGLAGAVGGWWAGHGIAEAINNDDDDHFRSEYERSPERRGDRAYEAVRPAYVAGHLAGRNPDYRGRSFEDVEPDLVRGWSADVVRHAGEWPSVRGHARSAFRRAREETASTPDDVG
jgi:hypothetical protein